MLTLAADRFTEEEFNLGPFSIFQINIFIGLSNKYFPQGVNTIYRLQY